MKGRRPELLADEIATFIKQYQRKHYPNMDPNDRRYDRDIEAKVKRMSPEELDDLLHGERKGRRRGRPIRLAGWVGSEAVHDGGDPIRAISAQSARWLQRAVDVAAATRFVDYLPCSVAS